jgi:hypothetical protein
MAHTQSHKKALPTPLAAWRGDASLFVVFWGYGVLFSSVIAAFFVAALYRGDTVAQQLLIAGFFVYTAFVVVSVWRCAAMARPPWGMVAQLLTIAWAGNTLLVVGFLQLRLVEGYLGL